MGLWSELPDFSGIVYQTGRPVLRISTEPAGAGGIRGLGRGFRLAGSAGSAGVSPGRPGGGLSFTRAWHQFRHTLGTRMANAGVSGRTIREVLGHTSWRRATSSRLPADSGA